MSWIKNDLLNLCFNKSINNFFQLKKNTHLLCNGLFIGNIFDVQLVIKLMIAYWFGNNRNETNLTQITSILKHWIKWSIIKWNYIRIKLEIDMANKCTSYRLCSIVVKHPKWMGMADSRSMWLSSPCCSALRFMQI